MLWNRFCRRETLISWTEVWSTILFPFLIIYIGVVYIILRDIVLEYHRHALLVFFISKKVETRISGPFSIHCPLFDLIPSSFLFFSVPSSFKRLLTSSDAFAIQQHSLAHVNTTFTSIYILFIFIFIFSLIYFYFTFTFP